MNFIIDSNILSPNIVLLRFMRITSEYFS